MKGARDEAFELQDMAQMLPSDVGVWEDYRPVLSGRLRPVDSPLGAYSVGDFSEWTAPGIYRIVLPGTGEHSYQFAIADGAFGGLPPMLLSFVHGWRSGAFENALRGPTHKRVSRWSSRAAVWCRP